jgi:hypothetical protein
VNVGDCRKERIRPIVRERTDRQTWMRERDRGDLILPRPDLQPEVMRRVEVPSVAVSKVR